MQYDAHNPWGAGKVFHDVTSVVLNVSHENISIVIDDKVVFSHSGGVTGNDARMIRFIAEGIAEKFNTQLLVNEKKEAVN